MPTPQVLPILYDLATKQADYNHALIQAQTAPCFCEIEKVVARSDRWVTRDVCDYYLDGLCAASLSAAERKERVQEVRRDVYAQLARFEYLLRRMHALAAEEERKRGLERCVDSVRECAGRLRGAMGRLEGKGEGGKEEEEEGEGEEGGEEEG